MASHREIQELLGKYLEATSTTAEEQQLQAYFNADDVAPHLQQYQPLFAYFDHARKQNLGPDVTLKSRPTKKMAWGLAVAASVAVLLGVGAYAYWDRQTEVPQEFASMDDPEAVFKQTQKALALLSGHVNTGIEGFSYLKEYELAKERVFPTQVQKN